MTKLWSFNFSCGVVNSGRLVISKIFWFASKSNFRRLCISDSLILQSLNIAVFTPDRLNIVCAPIGGRVIVPCPNSSADQVKFRLYKDGENIHHHMCNREINTSNNYPSTNAVGVEYKGAENNFSFTLTEVNASSHGIYRCEAISTFPPPLKELPSTPGIILLIEGKYLSVI